MKAASLSSLAQPVAQQPSGMASPATTGQQPSPLLSSNPGHASSRATARSPPAVLSYPDHCTHSSNALGLPATHSSHQHGGQSYPAHYDTSFTLPCAQRDRPGTADNRHDCSDAGGVIHHAGGALCDGGGPMQGAGGAMCDGGGAMCDGERPMHDAGGSMYDDLWTQEGGVVEYPAAYRQQV